MIGMILAMAAMAQEQPTHRTLEGTTGSVFVWMKSAAPVPRVELNSACRCMVVKDAKGKEILTLREDKRESDAIEALATALINVATQESYADWREYLDKLKINLPAKQAL